ncbi:MAG TPA: hypothetical protein VGX51_06940, partial [Solirubrobacteraceae bacterium]|nr:hypothetical protein [Solirubrobacteraceae bacterium]
MSERRRNAVVLTIVAVLIAASLLLVIVGIPGAVKARKTRLGLDLKGGVELVYRARPTAQSKVDSESVNRSIEVMRKRVDQLGVAQPEIQRSGEGEILVALPSVTSTQHAEKEVGKTAQLYFYDWEPNVIGPNGTAAPTEGTVTGDNTGGGAGGSTAGVPEYQAVLRAQKRAPVLPPQASDLGTLERGCTAQQEKGCIYGTWYLLDTKHEKVLHGPEETKANLYADNYRPPAGAVVQAVHINPGTIIVRAHPTETGAGKVVNKSPESWYVLNDNAVLTGSDITHPQQGFNEGSGGNGEPNVNFGFTGHGKSVFEGVTKAI